MVAPNKEQHRPVSRVTKALIVLALSLTVGAVRNILMVLDLTKNYEELNPTTNAAGCHLVSGFAADGFEDLVYLNASCAIGCAGDLGHVFTNRSYTLPGGRPTVCVLISTPSLGLPAVVIPLQFVSTRPSAIARMHLHGLDVVVRGDGAPTLYAVNHAFGSDGETIEVFNVHPDNASLVHIRTLVYTSAMTEALMGVANDVSIVRSNSQERKLFVTKYLEVADGPNGRAVSSAFLRNMISRALMYVRVATGFYNTEVILCEFGAEDVATSMRCTPAVTGLLMANGVASVPLPIPLLDVSVLITVDVLSHRLVVANSNGPFPIDSFSTPYVVLAHALDNINVDVRHPPHCKTVDTASKSATCIISLFGGVVASIWHASKIESMDDLHHLSPGGTSSIVLEVRVCTLTGAIKHAKLLSEKIIVMHDGSFQGTSVGLVLGDEVVMGSFKLQGLLVCPFNGGGTP